MQIGTRFLILLSTLMGVAASGCSSTTSGNSNPTLDSAATQVGQSLCGRWQTCNATAFATSFPNGINDCVTALKTSVENAASPRKPADPANCSESALQTCDDDINTLNCAEFAAGGTLVLPDTCKGKC